MLVSIESHYSSLLRTALLLERSCGLLLYLSITLLHCIYSPLYEMKKFAQSLWDHLSMIKFSHTVFALPLAGIAFVQALELSYSYPSSSEARDPSFIWILLLQVLLCMLFLRSSAMAFNRLVDRKYDAANPRTARRELPMGRLSARQVLFFAVFCALLFVITAVSINQLTGLLALPALFLVLAYSYTKRFTYLCHFVLGLAIGLAPTAAWIAVLERIDILPLLWSAAVLFYIAGFDILYACQDYDFDRKNNLYSLPACYGIGPALWIARGCHLLALLFFISAGVIEQSRAVFYLSVLCVGLLFTVEHILVRPQSLKHIPVAFFHINAMISTVLFVGVCLETYTNIL